jgi:hypothetical protein
MKSLQNNNIVPRNNCKGYKCPIKDNCNRYSKIKQNKNTYYKKTPGRIINEMFMCEMFWGKGSKLSQLEIKKIYNF